MSANDRVKRRKVALMEIDIDKSGYGYENRGALMSSEIPGKFICLMGGRHEKA